MMDDLAELIQLRSTITAQYEDLDSNELMKLQEKFDALKSLLLPNVPSSFQLEASIILGIIIQHLPEFPEDTLVMDNLLTGLRQVEDKDTLCSVLLALGEVASSNLKRRDYLWLHNVESLLVSLPADLEIRRSMLRALSCHLALKPSPVRISFMTFLPLLSNALESNDIKTISHASFVFAYHQIAMKREREEIDDKQEDNHRCQSEKGTKIVKLGESGCEARTEKKTDGNWLSHIMIRTKQTKLLKQMILSCFHSFVEAFPVKPSDISLIEDLHISLSQPFNLRYFLIKPFLSQLQTTCSRIEALSSSVAVANQCRLLYNNQRSRAFMTLKVIDTSKYLEKCVLHIDEVMKEYNFPVYYQPPIFHISIFSFPLTDPSDCDIYNDWSKDWLDFDITEDEGIHRDIGKDPVEAESDNEEEADEMLIEIPRETNKVDKKDVLSLLGGYGDPLRGVIVSSKAMIAIIGDQHHLIVGERDS